jgi:hypothetical protein
MWQYLGLLLLLVLIEDRKTFCPLSLVQPVTARPAQNDKYPVNSSHRSRFLQKYFTAVLLVIIIIIIIIMNIKDWTL